MQRASITKYVTGRHYVEIIQKILSVTFLGDGLHTFKAPYIRSVPTFLDVTRRHSAEIKKVLTDGFLDDSQTADIGNFAHSRVVCDDYLLPGPFADDVAFNP
jgi:hypothetical protein